MRKNLCNKAEEEYLMTHVFPKELVDLYEQGVVYIHDKQLSSYCQSVSCKDVATIIAHPAPPFLQYRDAHVSTGLRRCYVVSNDYHRGIIPVL